MWRRAELTERLLLAAGLIALGCWITWNLYSEHRQIEKGQRDRLAAQAKIIDDNLIPQLEAISSALTTIRKEVSGLAKLSDAGELFNRDLQALDDTMPEVRTLLVVDEAGRVVATDRPELAGRDFPGRDYFAAPKGNPDPATLYVSSPFRSVLGPMVISMSKAIVDASGHFRGAVVATLDPDYLGVLFRSVLYAPDAWAAMSHGDGIQFFMVPSHPRQEGKYLANPGSFFLRHRDSGHVADVFEGITYSTGEHRMMAIRTIRPPDLSMDKPLVVGVSRDWNAIFEPWRRSVIIQGGLFAILAIATVTGLNFYQRRQRRFAAISAAKEAREKRRAEQYRAIVGSAFDGFYYFDTTGRILDANESVCRMHGYTREEILGLRIGDLQTQESPEETARHIRAVMNTGEEQFQSRHRRKDGSIIDVEVNALHIPGLGPRLYSFVRDVTERNRAEQMLRDSLETLKDSQRLASLGHFQMDLGKGVWSSSEGLDAVLGIGPSYVRDRDGWVALVHPDDRKDLIAYRRDRVRNRHANFDREYRIVRHGDGATRWVRDFSRIEYDAGGRAAYLFGIVQDITGRKNAEDRLLTLSAAVEQSPESIVITGLDGRIEYINDAFCAISGYDRADAIGQNPRMLQSGLTPPETHREMWETVTKGRVWRGEFINRRRDGEIFIESAIVTPVRNRKGEPTHYLAVKQDITERKRDETDLRIAATAMESQDGLVITDAHGTILRVNQAFAAITGYSPEEAVGQQTNLLKSGMHGGDFYAAMWDDLRHRGFWRGELWNRRKNGEIYPEWLSITAVKGDDGAVTHYVGTFTDISRVKEAEQQIKELAFYDPLTGLPNRRVLMDRLRKALADAARSRRKGGLMFVDLDNFKTLNDSLGHAEGDRLLQQVAKRLSTCVREGDTVARLGGDEFVVMLEDLSTEAHEAAARIKAVGEKILAALSRPYDLSAQPHHSTASIGATVFGDQRESVDDVLKQADIAMYQGKAAGRNALRFFDPELQAAIRQRTEMESSLRRAIAADQFVLFYQPQVDADSGVIGAEVLLRWNHPERGVVGPAEFIPLAEETGIIVPLGTWALKTACAQIKAWEGVPEVDGLSLSVNVSARQFRQADFVDQVLTILERTGADPHRLKLELTESMLLDDTEETIRKMNALKARGVGFSLDDFGTGYSSLSYLKRLPLSQLKIDRSFVRDVLTDFNDAVIARTVVALGRSLRLSVVAEGVETAEQLNFLSVQGCHAYQGYLFSPPVPLAEFEALVRMRARLGVTG